MPVHHRKRNVTMRMQGSKTHCEIEAPLAGQKKATSGNVGRSRFVSWSIATVP